MKRKQNWIISSEHNWTDIGLRHLCQYKNLIYHLALRDITALYQQTILGPLWIIINPVFNTVIFTLIFGKLTGFSKPTVPQPLFYLSGIILWNFFAESLNRTASVFKDQQNLFEKVYFPRIIMPVSIILSMLFRFTIQLLIFALGIIFFKINGADIQLTRIILLLPILLMTTAVLALGLGMITASLTAKYRDLTLMFTFFVQLFMYATPVIYPLTAVPANLRPYFLANPMTITIEAFRLGFLGTGFFEWTNLLQSSITSLSFLLMGVIAFHKAEKNFLDTI